MYNINNITHLATYCGSKGLTLNKYCSNLPGELLLSNKQLDDVITAKAERQAGSCQITSAVRGCLRVTSL